MAALLLPAQFIMVEAYGAYSLLIVFIIGITKKERIAAS
jgi:hypothetical protein